MKATIFNDTEDDKKRFEKHDRLLTVITGTRDFTFKHAVAWVRNDFNEVKQIRFLNSVNACSIVFPSRTPSQNLTDEGFD